MMKKKKKKKTLTGMKRVEKNHRAKGRGKKNETDLAFENRLLCCSVMK